MRYPSENEKLSEALLKIFMQFGRLRMKEVTKDRRKRPHHILKRSEVMLLLSLNYQEDQFPEGISVSDISRTLQVKPPSITSVITSLEQKQMLERIMDTNDRRIVRVKMTEAGRQFIHQRKQCMIQQVEGLVNYLGQEKSAALVGLMEETYQYFKNQKKQI